MFAEFITHHLVTLVECANLCNTFNGGAVQLEMFSFS